MTRRIGIMLSSEASANEELLHVLGPFLEEATIPESVRHAILVVLDEITSNVFAHAYPRGEQQGIGVEVAVGAGWLEIDATDSGVPFDPLTMPPPDLTSDAADREIGGLGLHLARTLMDEMHYERRDGRNWVRLRKTWTM